MPDVSNLYYNGTSYEIKDATARSRMLPAGGNAGYILKKNSNTDYDTVWGEYEGGTSIPDGGTKGQILAKNSDSNGDISWYSPGNTPSSAWYLPQGVQEYHVMAAYQFVGRDTEYNARQNVNHGMPLTLTKSSSSVTWSSEKGFFIPATANEGLKNDILKESYANIYSVAFGYSDLRTGKGTNQSDYVNKGAGGFVANEKRYLTLRGIKSSNAYLNQPTMNESFNSTRAMYANIYRDADPIEGTPAESVSKGVFACDWQTPQSTLYRNQAWIPNPGTDVTIVDYSSRIASPTVLFGQFQTVNFVSFYVTALVIYNISLTPEQHGELSDNIRALGGIE